jgi:hypothetical protein
VYSYGDYQSDYSEYSANFKLMGVRENIIENLGNLLVLV